MYAVKDIFVNNNEYMSSRIISVINGQISAALISLNESVFSEIRNNFGSKMSNIEVIDIDNDSQIIDPQVDGISLYRYTSDPHKIHLYERSTEIIEQPSWTWGATKVPVSKFAKTNIYELEDISGIGSGMKSSTHANSNVDIPVCDMVGTKMGIKIPKQMTVSPMCDVLVELKNSPVFKNRHVISAMLEEKVIQCDCYIEECVSDISEYSEELSIQDDRTDELVTESDDDNSSDDYDDSSSDGDDEYPYVMPVINPNDL